jgi:hypothetical protein
MASSGFSGDDRVGMIGRPGRDHEQVARHAGERGVSLDEASRVGSDGEVPRTWSPWLSVRARSPDDRLERKPDTGPPPHPAVPNRPPCWFTAIAFVHFLGAVPSPCQVRAMSKNAAHQRQTTKDVRAGQSQHRGCDQGLRERPTRSYKAEVAGSRPAAPTHKKAGQQPLLGESDRVRDACAAPRALRMQAVPHQPVNLGATTNCVGQLSVLGS